MAQPQPQPQQQRGTHGVARSRPIPTSTPAAAPGMSPQGSSSSCASSSTNVDNGSYLAYSRSGPGGPTTQQQQQYWNTHPRYTEQDILSSTPGSYSQDSLLIHGNGGAQTLHNFGEQSRRPSLPTYESQQQRLGSSTSTNGEKAPESKVDLSGWNTYGATGDSNASAQSQSRPSYTRARTGASNAPGASPPRPQPAGADSNLSAFVDNDIDTSSNLGAFFAALGRLPFFIRWLVFVIPVLALLWIPGIIQLSGAAPNARVWGCPLVWWSAWLSVVWGGWWVAALVARVLPTMLKKAVGVVAPDLRHYIGYASALKLYTGATGWAVANWVSFLPLIRNHVETDSGATALHLITQALFGIFLCTVILLIEKLVIQVIAHNYHKKSYEDRLAEQQFQINVLARLYSFSRDTGRADTLPPPHPTSDEAADGFVRPNARRQGTDPSLIVKAVLSGAKKVAQTQATVIGTLASEISGERVLQPNSPRSMVLNALASATKARQLARRLFYSFVRHGHKDDAELELQDLLPLFGGNEEITDRAFDVFDRDGNGGVSVEEMELACLDVHRERVALQHSMRDIDSAVGRLDDILTSVWWVVAVLIMVGLLNTQFEALIVGGGTFVLGLSWLIGATAQEIISSSIFLFVKHAYDVGDKVQIDADTYVVKEMALLSTVFQRTDGVIVQAPHTILNTKFIQNIRRSGPISEKILFDVDFGTTYEKIDALRARLLDFVQAERRDYQPSVDVTLQDFADQSKLQLKTEIRYKSNLQNGALASQRRTRFVCALKDAMHDLEIYGPGGNGDPTPAARAEPTCYTQMPFDAYQREILSKDAEKEAAAAADEQARQSYRHSSDRDIMDIAAIYREEAGDNVLLDEREQHQQTLRARQNRRRSIAAATATAPPPSDRR